MQDLTTGAIAFFKFPCEARTDAAYAMPAAAVPLSAATNGGSSSSGGGKKGGDDLWRGSGDVSALLKSVMGEAAAGGE